MEWAIVVCIMIILDVWGMLSYLVYEYGWKDPYISRLLVVGLEFLITAMSYLAFLGVCSCGA